MVSPRFALALLALVFPGVTSSIIVSREVTVSTPLGTAQGVLGAVGANRFAVRYASAERWAPSAVVTKWSLPNNSTDPAALPLQCPQNGVDASTYSEDCLSMIFYVPVTVTAGSNVPTLVWIHGGSFDSGSATGTGLDGSKLAVATNSVVAVIQYRLGALGLLAPNGPLNLAVQDTINALQFVQKVVPSFGGNPARVTLAGQSSGAGMIRALFAAPSASSLFHSAVLGSDPMDYGFTSTKTQSLLQSTFDSLISCSPSDSACLAAVSISDILDAQASVESNSQAIDPSTALGEPLHPVLDGTLITNPLDSTAPFPKVTKPILLTNVRNESIPTIYGVALPGPDPFPDFYFEASCDVSLGAERTAIVMDSPYYPLDASQDVRVQLEVLGTDYVWRCPTWTFARSWVANGGKAFVGMFTLGATYPDNEGVPECLKAGAVCHEDDIFIIFGTTPNPSPAQTQLTFEIQMRWKMFMLTDSPNAPAFPPWLPATTTDVHAREFGVLTTPSGEVPALACDPAFWGQEVQYDYQFYDL
ncbi:alpha beta-hydrolase [Roridomyces roridus]|uniref:Carboxylic ester hydrolase n=1 Tax=Roridomyces roridus TaxID=1738132 RepID=A0AAD7FTN5_9AGAR|nr:alpha beta-hydrolase [Roridomyces roridus]